MNGRCCLHSRVLEITLGETSSTSEPMISTFEVEDTIEEILNQNQNRHVDQAIRIMKLREYFDPTESQSYTRISAPLADNMSFRIDRHMLQLLLTFYGRFNEEPYEFLEEFTDICMIYNYPGVSKEHLKMRIFPLALKDKAKEWFNLVGQEFTSWSEIEKCFLRKF